MQGLMCSINHLYMTYDRYILPELLEEIKGVYKGMNNGQTAGYGDGVFLTTSYSQCYLVFSCADDSIYSYLNVSLSTSLQ